MKRKDVEEKPEVKTLEERAFDLLGEFIIRRQGEDALRELAIEDEQHSEVSQWIDAHCLKYDKENLALINRFFLKKKIKEILLKVIPRYLKRITIIFGIFFIVCSIAFAVHRPFRVQVQKILSDVDESVTLKLFQSPDS